MARKRKSSKDEQAAFEQEQANRPINPTGEGEVQAVKDLLSPEFEQMSNFDATQIALALQEILRGQKSLLANQDTMGLEIARLKEHQDKVDERIAQAESRRNKEIEDILERSSKLVATGDKKDRIVAKGAQLYQQARQQAVASQSVVKLQFEEQLRLMPKETIVSPGVWIQTREGQRLDPEEVRIKHKVWLLQPGVPTEVPKAVGDVIRDRRKSQTQTSQMKQALGKQQEQSKLAQEWSKLDGKASPMPLA